jgi:hypothetical protein
MCPSNLCPKSPLFLVPGVLLCLTSTAVFPCCFCRYTVISYYIISYKAPTVFFQVYLAFLGCIAGKLYIIPWQSLCRVAKCGLDFLEVFENPYDFPQPVIILLSCLVSRILIIFWECWTGKFVNDVLEGIWKEVDVTCFNVQCKCLPGMTKEHNENSQSK